MAVLVVLPLVLFALPAALGHPAVTGDNLIQNFPLRVLSGRQLAQGHLPLWNPYIWSGSPLLGGLNAGSFYPLTLVFAVAAPMLAWVLNLAAVYWAAGLGLYALGRQYGLAPLACLLGALVYAFAGAMSGQIVHLGVIEGMGWMPLLVLAEVRLSWAVLGTGPVLGATSRGTPVHDASSPGVQVAAGSPDLAPDASGPVAPARPRRTSPWPWVALLALVVGLEALTGEPRAMAETEMVGTVVALWLVLRPYRGAVAPGRRAFLLGWTVLAGVWGAALAAAELAPGWSFIRASQRSAETYAFFGTGSLHVSWSALLLVPDLFGGAGLWGQPRFLDHYNLNEVTGYVGVLAIAAAAALCTRTFGRRRAPMASDWGMWLALGALGLVLAWGSYTPLGHVWAAIPLFGKTRLQSRSLGICDLALAMCLAFWADRALAGRGAEAGLSGWRRSVLAAPPALSALLCVLVWAFPVGTEEFFGATAQGGADARGLWGWMLAQLVVAVATGAVLVGWQRTGPSLRRGALVALVVGDLALFVLATSTVVSSTTPTTEPSRAVAAAVLGTTGRFAIYDTTAEHIYTLATVGQPDLNAFTGLSSVQGYGSILAQTYATATGAHTLDDLTPCDLARGVFTPLRLSTVLAIPMSLAPGVSATGTPLPAPRCPGAPLPGTATSRTLYIGRLVGVRTATIVAGSSLGGGAGPPLSAVERERDLRVGVLSATGRTEFPADTVRWTGHGWSVRFRRTVDAVALVVHGDARAVLDTSSITGVATGRVGRWAFDGVMQNALAESSWRFSGLWDDYMRFSAIRVLPPVWLAGAPTTHSSNPLASTGAAERGNRVRQVSTTDWGTEVDRVSADRTVTVVRSEAYLAGWKAEITPVGGGASRALTVERRGLVQSVRVPAGRWILTFSYRPPHLSLGLAGSAAAVAGFVALGTASLVRRRRRAPPGRRGGPARAGTVGSVT